jgi:histidinol phosphatase-like enzyme
MPLTLDQYASYLDTRDLVWPVAPQPEPPKARAYVQVLPGVRAVLWNVYGTLLSISSGELLFEHSDEFIMNVALDKAIQEFKMWNSMSRKPGQPADYMKEIYIRVVAEHKLSLGSEKYPEVLAERVWENIIKKLFQKEYKFDAGFFGSLNEFSRKVAYFFHASLQGTACYLGAAEAIKALAAAGLAQGLLADAQCFTSVQLKRGLEKQDDSVNLDESLPISYRFLSCERRCRKPSENLFRHAVKTLAEQGIEPAEMLHVGSSMTRDLAPAKKFGMRTALFAGDRQSLLATAEQLKDPNLRPDVLLTELSQIAQVIG